MTWQYPRWTLQQAQQIGFSIWDLYYTRWGVATGNPLVGTGELFPNAVERADLSSVFGLAIGPRSTVGRLFLSFTVPTSIVSGSGVVPTWPPDTKRIIDYYTCGVGYPLLAPAPGPLVLEPTLPLFDQTTASPTQYYPDGAAAAALPFASMEMPALHLQFLLKNTPQLMIPIIREQLIRHIIVTNQAQDQAEVFQRGYPIQGRRSVRINFRVTAGTVSFRVGGLSYGGLGGDGASVEPLIEQTLGSAAGVTGNDTASVTVPLNHEFLMIYRNITAGPGSFQVDILADDNS